MIRTIGVFLLALAFLGGPSDLMGAAKTSVKTPAKTVAPSKTAKTTLMKKAAAPSALKVCVDKNAPSLAGKNALKTISQAAKGLAKAPQGYRNAGPVLKSLGAITKNSDLKQAANKLTYGTPKEFGQLQKVVNSPSFKNGQKILSSVNIGISLSEGYQKRGVGGVVAAGIKEAVKYGAVKFGGAALGAKAGAAIGGAVGTLIAPGPGTALGAMAGGAVGGYAASYLADYAVESAFGRMQLEDRIATAVNANAAAKTIEQGIATIQTSMSTALRQSPRFSIPCVPLPKIAPKTPGPGVPTLPGAPSVRLPF